MFDSLLKALSDLEKAAQHKYTHKKRVGTDKKGRPRWRYFYNVRHGGGIGGAALEVKGGEAFQLTHAGQRGHFHVQRVRGNRVTVRHDETGHEVTMSKRELQALLMQEHGDKFKRQKKKPAKAKREKKKPAREQLTEATRGADNFETMPEVESIRAEFKRKLAINEGDPSLYVKLFNAANYSETLASVPDSELFAHPITQELFSLTGKQENNPVYVFLALRDLPKEYTERLYNELLRRFKAKEPVPEKEGVRVAILQAHQVHFEDQYPSRRRAAPLPIKEKQLPILGLNTLDLDPKQVQGSYRNISHTPTERAEAERREWVETLDQLEAQAQAEIQAGAQQEEVEKRYQKLARRLLRTKINVISARSQTASSAITGRGNFNSRQAEKRQRVLESRETQYRQALQEIKDTQPPKPTTPRLTATKQGLDRHNEILDAAIESFDSRSPSLPPELQPMMNELLDAHESGQLPASMREDSLAGSKLSMLANKYEMLSRKVSGRNQDLLAGIAEIARGLASGDNFETMPEVETQPEPTKTPAQSAREALKREVEEITPDPRSAFDEEHGISEQGGAKDRIKQAASEYVQSLKDISEALQSRDSAAYQKAIKDADTNNKALKAEMEKELVVEGKTPQEQAATLKELRAFVDQIINNPLRNVKGIPRAALVFYSDVGRDLESKLDKYERDIEEHQTELQEQDEDFKKVQAYDVNPSDVAPADLQRELKRVQDIRALSDKLTDRYPNARANNYKLDTNSRGKLARVEDALKQRIQSNQGTLDAKQLADLERGDTLQYKGKSYSVRSKRNLKGINGFKITLDAKDGSDTMSLKVYPEGVTAADSTPVIVSA